MILLASAAAVFPREAEQPRAQKAVTKTLIIDGIGDRMDAGSVFVAESKRR